MIYKYILTLLFTTQLYGSSFVAEDKAKHIVAGAIINTVCLYIVNINDFKSKYCLLPILTIAVGKEVYDNSNGGTAEFSDITATMFVPMTTYIIYTW